MKRGFTLVELSIVLIIIGLLLGGIMAAKGLITAAETQAIISDFQKYDAAAQAYNKKYRAWPGDDDGALTRWTDDPAVVNGDGNGLLTEYLQFWVHLSKARLITGTYTGEAGSVPLSALEGYYVGHYSYASYPARQAFWLSADGGYPPVKKKYATAVDKKIDDGIFNTGVVQSYDWLGASCAPAIANCAGIAYIYKP